MRLGAWNTESLTRGSQRNPHRQVINLVTRDNYPRQPCSSQLQGKGNNIRIRVLLCLRRVNNISCLFHDMLEVFVARVERMLEFSSHSGRPRTRQVRMADLTCLIDHLARHRNASINDEILKRLERFPLIREAKSREVV